jgi:hypothetical protein
MQKTYKADKSDATMVDRVLDVTYDGVESNSQLDDTGIRYSVRQGVGLYRGRQSAGRYL